MRPPPCYALPPFRIAHFLAQKTPRPVSTRAGATLAHAVYLARPEARRALKNNLSLVTGLTGEPLQALCQENVGNFGAMLADYFHFAGRDPERIRPLLGEWRGFEHLQAARDRGKGTIIVTAHLGNWELGGILLALQGLPMSIVTLQEPSHALTVWRDKCRKRAGIKSITVGNDPFAFVEMISALKRNECVAMLVDRPYPGSGSPVRLFGRPTEFSTGPALLWQQTDATVLPAFVLSISTGKYLSLAEPAVEFAAAADRKETVIANTQRLATAFEGIIREHPEQWFNYVPIWPAQ